MQDIFEMIPFKLIVFSFSLFTSTFTPHAATASQWGEPITLIENYGRLAIGNQHHVIGQSGGKLILVAADGHVFACWQREGGPSGLPILSERLGYNFSSDGGVTWGDAKVLPQDSGVDRNHQEVWMTSGGDVHLCWRHGFTDEDPLGYIHSGDYGKTWDKSEIAFVTPGGNHPFFICANKNRVHVLTAPQGEMKYASRLVKPVVTRIEKTNANLILKSTKSVPFYKLFGKYLLGVLP